MCLKKIYNKLWERSTSNNAWDNELMIFLWYHSLQHDMGSIVYKLENIIGLTKILATSAYLNTVTERIKVKKKK